MLNEKRADGRYCKQIVIGYQSNGKRKLKTIYGKTIREVEKKEREFRAELEQGLIISNSQDVLMEDWARMWLNTYKCNAEHNTYVMYENAVNKHIIPYFRNQKIKTIKSIQVQQLLNQLVAENHLRLAEIVCLTLKQLIKQARIDGYITNDIMEAIKPIKNKAEERRVLTDEEIRLIDTAELNPKQKNFLGIMLYAGLRRGEVLALTVDDIDLENKLINVNKNLYFKDNQSGIKSPKSKAGYRSVPIIDKLADELITYLKTLNNDVLFPMLNGEYMTKSSYRKFWIGIIKALNQSSNTSIDFTPHICRHTYATSLYYSGIDIKTAQYLLGHASLKMTLEVYTHLDKKKMPDEIYKLNEYVSQSKISQYGDLELNL